MRFRIHQVKVPLAYDDAAVRRETARKLGCPPERFESVVVVRRSLDARPRNPHPLYVLTIEAALATPPPRAAGPDVEPLPADLPRPAPPRPVRLPDPPPVVVGAGPAGLMAAHALAQAGARPRLIERGDDAGARAPKASLFWNQGTLDPESNVLYGEGGAGLFSDGKLTARSKERGRVHAFLDLLHACGAPESVVLDAEPHVGSDLLLGLVPRLRQRILDAGGAVEFRARLDRLVVEKGILRAVVVNGREIACSRCVLAIGHSARDTVAGLAAAGVALSPRPFAVGVRLELPQEAIDRAQYGRWAGHPRLGAASFRLTRREEADRRPCYSFCMCPGGTVIACASEAGFLTTNGMSYSRRALPRGNAAFLAPVEPADYPPHPVPALAGYAFQRELEKRAFEAGGGAYAAPASPLADFLAGRTPSTLPPGGSCRRAVACDLRPLLPEAVVRTLAGAIPPMLRELNGVRLEDAVLYASETRSSSPVRIDRHESGESVNVAGLFPAGEGAGYAGGIVSSAVDGLRQAEALLAAAGAAP